MADVFVPGVDAVIDKKIYHEGLALYAEAQELAIASDTDFEVVGEFQRSVKIHIGVIESMFAGREAEKRADLKMVVDQKKAWLEGPRAAVEVTDHLLSEWSLKKSREKAIAQQRAAEEAKAIVATARAEGRPAPPVLVIPAAVPQPKAEGIGFRDYARAVVKDKRAFLVWLAEYTSPDRVDADRLLDLVKVDQGALDELAKYHLKELELVDEVPMRFAGVVARKERRSITRK